jgi:hypothetical protein
MQFSSLPISSSLHNNPRYQFSLKSENIEIVPILSAAILKIVDFARDFFWVRIFYQPYLIYMPSLVEIPLAVSDISEVNYFDICSQFPWQRRPFWKFQDWMGIHLPVNFSKDQIISLLRIWLDKFTARRRRGRLIIFNYSLALTDTKDCNCFITLKWKVKVKPSLRDFCKSSFYFCKPIACVGHDDHLFILM